MPRSQIQLMPHARLQQDRTAPLSRPPCVSSRHHSEGFHDFLVTASISEGFHDFSVTASISEGFHDFSVTASISEGFHDYKGPV